MALFSMRHRKALDSGVLQVTLAKSVRNTLVRICQEYDPVTDLVDETNWHYEGRVHAPEAVRIVLTDTGIAKLPTRSGKTDRYLDSFEPTILRDPAHLALSLLEAFLRVLPEEEATECEKDLRVALLNHGSEWCIVDGAFFKIDSDYLAQEVIARSAQLVRAAGFQGAQDEFTKARAGLANGDYRETVNYASHALESTIKAILGRDTGRPKELVRELLKSGLIPSYYEGFLDSFDDILHAVIVEGNQPGRRHGQGATVIEVPRELAELALHLSGSLILFMVRHSRPEPEPRAEETPTAPEGEDYFGG